MAKTVELKKTIRKTIGMAMAVILAAGSLSACTNEKQVSAPDNAVIAQTGNNTESLANSVPASSNISSDVDVVCTATNTDTHNDTAAKNYNEGVILVKTKAFETEKLGELSVVSAEPLYKNSLWYKVILDKGTDTAEAVAYLEELNTFDKVDYDYIMGADGTAESVDVSGNPDYSKQSYYDTMGIPAAWDWLKTERDLEGGSPDVVVAIIDTGVDYNHIDLRNNVWVNTAEIPNNGIDDDGNGYVDDYYGWDCVNNDNDPMDDNGHGTHVAGIVAAENNDFGTVGVAFGCKIMCLKAGNASGYFNNSDIAEAIQYAYMNGASVINMSFGGSSVSAAVKEALADAYNQCILVAAAGNDGLCNNTDHDIYHPIGISYPAAFPYVIGVMSTNSVGETVSSFSNYDDTPFNQIEYEVYACGEQIVSTWPQNRVSALTGTSMACPVVAGIAALMRSYFSDRQVYSHKFIQSHIVSNTNIHPFNDLLKEADEYHGVADAYKSLTESPAPRLSLYDYYIFDSEDISPENNGNGVIEAGETIRLAIELINRGGVAKDVVVNIDSDDPNLTDPHINVISGNIELGTIGVYSVRDCGKIYDDDNNLTQTTLFFEVEVASGCPDSYLFDLNLNIGYEDENNSEYSWNGSICLTVHNGYILPEIISEDTVFEADRLYIVSNSVVIPEGVSVLFNEGCHVQFYTSSDDYYNGLIYNSPCFSVYGNLTFNGSAENMIEIYPSDHYYCYACMFETNDSGFINMEYVRIVNFASPDFYGTGNINISDSILLEDRVEEGGDVGRVMCFERAIASSSTSLEINQINSSVFVFKRYFGELIFGNMNGCYIDLCSTRQLRIKGSGMANSILHTKFEQDNPYCSYTSKITNAENCVFISESDNNPLDLLHFALSGDLSWQNNYFSSGYRRYASDVFDNFRLSDGTSVIDLYGDCSNYNTVYPFVKNVELLDADDQPINYVGTGAFKIRLSFSREMDVTKEIKLYFGTVYPYADYSITGDFVSPTVWEGSYTVNALIENGLQTLTIKGGYAKNDGGLQKYIVEDSFKYVFDINTSSALSMSLQAEATGSGVALSWLQDDYETLMGYNIYRSTEKDGNFVRLNKAAITPEEHSFVDEDAEPGVTYWYTFTVVLSDMTESAPAGKVSCTMIDTLAPSVYHTPVNQGYIGKNLVITCTASDNIGVASATLYYRTKGATAWNSLDMLKQNDKYSATVFGSDLSSAGLEYYIVVKDGINTVTKGNAAEPYSVVIKDASALSGIGDVDGDGTVTTKDALMLIQSINGDLLLTDDQFRRADLDKDEVLSSVEALRILQYINGNVNTLEM